MATGYGTVITRGALAQALERAPKKRRLLLQPRDIFKRQYTCSLDLAGEDGYRGIVGLIEKRFVVPDIMDIPQKYHSVSIEHPTRMKVDFLAYARDIKNARADWVRRGMEEAERIPGEKYEGGENFSVRVIARIGTPPRPDWQLVVLAARGDPWCLGFAPHTEPTPAVRHILGDDYFKRRVAVIGRTARTPLDLQLSGELEALIGRNMPRGAPVWHDEKEDEDAYLAAMREQMGLDEDSDNFTPGPEDMVSDQELDDALKGEGLELSAEVAALATPEVPVGKDNRPLTGAALKLFREKQAREAKGAQ